MKQADVCLQFTILGKHYAHIYPYDTTCYGIVQMIEVVFQTPQFNTVLSYLVPLNTTSFNGSSCNNVCNGTTESSLMHTLKTVSVINFDPELETKESMDREFRESQSVCDCKLSV